MAAIPRNTQFGDPADSGEFAAHVRPRTLRSADRHQEGRARPGAGSAAGPVRRSRTARRRAPFRAPRQSGRLAVRFPRKRWSRQGPLHLRRRRPRQDHADGPVLRGVAGGAQAPRAFPRVHGGRARAGARVPPADQGRRDRGRRSDPAHRRRDRRGKLAALLRRVPCHRHRRCDDPRPVVHPDVRARRGGGRDLERGARRSLQGRAQPLAVPAVHRHA